MSNANLIRSKEAGNIAVDLIIKFIRNSKKEKIKILFPGGRTVEKIGTALINNVNNIRDELSRLYIYQLDEFQPIPERKETNREVLKRVFINSLISLGAVKDEQFIPFEFSQNVEDSLNRYSELCEDADIIILGAGGGKHPDGNEDTGHVAAIFPEIQSLWKAEKNFVQYDGAPKPPSSRMTATPNFIKKTPLIIGLILGEEKRNALENYLNITLTDKECPIKLVNYAKEGYLITDLE